MNYDEYDLGWLFPSDKLTAKRPSGTGRIGARQISAPVRRRWVSPVPGGEIFFWGKCKGDHNQVTKKR